MTAKAPKILSEFTLLPEGKKALQNFFDANFQELCGIPNKQAAEKAQKELQELLKKTLPKQFLRNLSNLLSDKSEYAILIHGLPENNLEWAGLKGVNAEDTYSYHIGKALYAMKNVAHIDTEVLVRRAGNGRTPPGLLIHRDNYPDAHMKFRGEFVIFSSPYNAENAMTEIIPMQYLIENIPEDVRKKIEVAVTGNFAGTRNYYLDELLDRLNTSRYSEDHIRKIALISEPESPEGKVFTEKREKIHIKKSIQPGDLLIINERNMFHHAYLGDSANALNPEDISRIFMHHAGARIER